VKSAWLFLVDLKQFVTGFEASCTQERIGL